MSLLGCFLPCWSLSTAFKEDVQTNDQRLVETVPNKNLLLNEIVSSKWIYQKRTGGFVEAGKERVLCLSAANGHRYSAIGNCC